MTVLGSILSGGLMVSKDEPSPVLLPGTQTSGQREGRESVGEGTLGKRPHSATMGHGF